MFKFFKKMSKDKEDELIFKTKIEGRGTEKEIKEAERILAKRANEKVSKYFDN